MHPHLIRCAVGIRGPDKHDATPIRIGRLSPCMVAGAAGAADAGAPGAAYGRWSRWSGRRWSAGGSRWSLGPLERPTLEHLERPMVAGAAGTADACINSSIVKLKISEQLHRLLIRSGLTILLGRSNRNGRFHDFRFLLLHLRLRCVDSGLLGRVGR